MIGHLVKITSAKKLMVKISETALDSINARCTSECKKRNFPTRLAAFTMTDNDGNDNYFVMISLDKYDRQNIRKFEQMLKKDVAFQYRMKPYDFIPEGETEQVCGINLELISIHQVKPKSKFLDAMDELVIARLNPSKELNAEEQAIDDDDDKKVAQTLLDTVLVPPRLQRRRRTPVTATPQQLTDLESAVNEALPRSDLDDVIAAQEKL